MEGLTAEQLIERIKKIKKQKTPKKGVGKRRRQLTAKEKARLEKIAPEFREVLQNPRQE